MLKLLNFNASVIFLLLGAGLLLAAPSRHAPASLGDAKMNWPGIEYQITFIKRLPQDRLLVGVRVLATAEAPPNGTLIGYPPTLPPNVDRMALASGHYPPHPLSLMSSIMVDDLTQQQYPALPSISPPGQKYLPSRVLGYLRPRQNLMMTVQFAVPPPPPPDPSGDPPPKPTVSFLFTEASEPVRRVALPAPEPAAATDAAASSTP